MTQRSPPVAAPWVAAPPVAAPPGPVPVACKVCGAPAHLFGVVDFQKSCVEHDGPALKLSGVPIYYHRCGACGLMFTTAFDHWDLSLFAEHIYNDGYATVDPDYLERRPAANAAVVAGLVARAPAPRVLDYGGGNGRLAALLRSRGVAADSWDPMVDASHRPDRGAYDVVTSFEVFEHTPDPVATCAEALSFLKPDGVLFFTTLTLADLPLGATQHWYIAPRNGHVTIHTRASLQTLFARFGRRLHHNSDLTHLALRTLPAWLA